MHARIQSAGLLFLFFVLGGCTFHRPGVVPPGLPTPAATVLPTLATPVGEAPTGQAKTQLHFPMLGAAPILPPTPRPGASLRDLAGERLKIGAAVELYWFINDPAYPELLTRDFNLITPENSLKFERVHPEPDRYAFDEPDALVDFALANELQVRGHTLVWDRQLPKWVKKGAFTQSEWRRLLRDHIRAVVSHYRGRVYAWDVVNEAIAEDGSLKDNLWLKSIGPEYIALAFAWAHEADPGALLFYNDFGGEGLGAKSQAIYALVRGLVEAGAPIHGVGLEMHTRLGAAPARQDLDANLLRLGELGLQVHITEMDVSVAGSGLSEAEAAAAAAAIYGDVIAACLGAPHCTSFATWGVADRHSWLATGGSSDAPLLLDREGRPKPAYSAVQEALRRR